MLGAMFASAAAQVQAISGDGQWLIAASEQPVSLSLFDADRRLVRTLAAVSQDGQSASRVASLKVAHLRKSFIVTFTDMRELWEISYDPKAEPIFDGLVHDYRMGEGIGRPGFLGARRTALAAPLAVLLLDHLQRHVLGAWLGQDGGMQDKEAAVQVINLDIRRRITEIKLDAPASSGEAVIRDGQQLLTLTVPQNKQVVVIDPKGWTKLRTVSSDDSN